MPEGPADVLLTLGPPPACSRWPRSGRTSGRRASGPGSRSRSGPSRPGSRALLRREARGRWVAVTTTLGAQPFPGGGADGAAAVALQTLVRIAAIEYGARGLRANAIAAGFREGELPAGLDPELARSDTPTGRLGSAADLAGTVAWLLSADADQVERRGAAARRRLHDQPRRAPRPAEALTVQELAPGIHRIESDLGVRSMAQYLLLGEERSVLVDTGLAGHAGRGADPGARGGRRRARRGADQPRGRRPLGRQPAGQGALPAGALRLPRARPALDRERRGDAGQELRWHVPYGWTAPTSAAMLALLGGDAPIDVGLQGEGRSGSGPAAARAPPPAGPHAGPRRSLGRRKPGRPWWSTRRSATASTTAHGSPTDPAPLLRRRGYRATIRRIRALEPELLLTAHYDPMDAAAARAFCDGSPGPRRPGRGRRARAAGRRRGAPARAHRRRGRALGPYPEFTSEIAAGVRSHLAALGPPVTPLGCRPPPMRTP